MKRMIFLILVFYHLVANMTAQGGWHPSGADLSFPRTLVDSLSVSAIRLTLNDTEILPLYQAIWENAYAIAPGEDSTDGARITRAIMAKETAFVILMERKYENGQVVVLEQTVRDSLILKTKHLLETMNTRVGFQTGWVFYQEWQNRSKELINYLTAYDLLRGAGVTSENLQVSKDSLIRFTANLYHRAMDTYIVFLFPLQFFNFQFNNHSIMTASALGLAAIIFNDYENADPEKQPVNWINAGMWNLDNSLWVQNGIYPRVSDPDSLTGYAEGPGYFNYSFQNAFPFIRAMGNFLPDSSFPFTFNQITREIRNPWFDPRYDRIYSWMNKIRMPDGSVPAIHDSPVNFGTSIMALSGKPEFNWSNPSFSLNDPFIRTQYIATNITHGSINEPLFQALPEAGSLIFRSGWDTGASYLHFIGKHGIALSGAKSHHQGDASSFSLFAFGELLALDPGYPGAAQSNVVNKPTDHNLILVDGNGPRPPNGEFVSTLTNTAYIEHAFDTPRLDYGEVRINYDGAEIIRKTLFVRNSYFLVGDFITASDPHDYTFQLHGNGLFGSSPHDPEGAFIPDFNHQGGNYQRDSVSLYASVAALNGPCDYQWTTDSLAIGSGTYRHYSKMLVTPQIPIKNNIFFSTLFPKMGLKPGINRILNIDGAFGAWIATEKNQEVVFCQQESVMQSIPPLLSALMDTMKYNGKMMFYSTSAGGAFQMAFLHDGDSLILGKQVVIGCSIPMDATFEINDADQMNGYVSTAGEVGFYSEKPFRVLEGNISEIGYDAVRKLCQLRFSGKGNFKLEATNGIDESRFHESLQISVTPNPSFHGHFEIHILDQGREMLDVHLLDGTGKMVKSFSVRSNGENQLISLDLSGFSAGRYILQVSGQRIIRTIPIVKL